MGSESGVLVRAGVGVEAPAGDGEGLDRAWVAVGVGTAEGAGAGWGAQPHKTSRASSRGRSRKGTGSPPLHGMVWLGAFFGGGKPRGWGQEKGRAFAKGSIPVGGGRPGRRGGGGVWRSGGPQGPPGQPNKSAGPEAEGLGPALSGRFAPRRRPPGPLGPAQTPKGG